MKTLKLEIGALSDPISEQLTRQGFCLEKKNGERYDSINHAIAMCGFHVASFSQVEAMRKRLLKIIKTDIEKGKA